MDFVMAACVILLSVIICIMSTVLTVIVGIALANYMGLTGIVWWSFIILFWLVITSMLGRKTN